MADREKIADVEIISTNPGIKLNITDETILGLFTDVAACKVQIKVLSAVSLLGFSTVIGLIVTLGS